MPFVFLGILGAGASQLNHVSHDDQNKFFLAIAIIFIILLTCGWLQAKNNKRTFEEEMKVRNEQSNALYKAMVEEFNKGI